MTREKFACLHRPAAFGLDPLDRDALPVPGGHRQALPEMPRIVPGAASVVSGSTRVLRMMIREPSRYE